MTLEHVQKAYEEVGAEDPLWAILTDDSKRGGAWKVDEFFATGREEIDEVMAFLDGLDVKIERGSAFDFGCGVGRLTQGLSKHFTNATGVDISHTMIEGANRFNRFGENCTYITNTEPHLECLDSGIFDFVYSNIVLQHMAPRYQVGYIKEFLRILKPGGTALFQVRAAQGPRAGSLAEKLYSLRTERLRPFWKSIRGRPPIQVHTISPQVVEQTIDACDATLLEVTVMDTGARRSRQSLRYCAFKPSAP